MMRRLFDALWHVVLCLLMPDEYRDIWSEPPMQPLWFSGPRYSIGYHSPGMVASGCILKPITWWEEHIRRCAEEHGYTADEVKEYEWRVKALAEWMKLWGVYELPEAEPAQAGEGA